MSETFLEGGAQLKLYYFRAGFYWGFVQTSNEKLRETGCQEKLISMLAQKELTLPMVKRVLTTVCHRLEVSRSTGYIGTEGLLQFLGGFMTLAKRNLLPQHFYVAKEFMISRLNNLKVLCMTPVPDGVRDGKSSCGLVQRCNRGFSSARK